MSRNDLRSWRRHLAACANTNSIYRVIICTKQNKLITQQSFVLRSTRPNIHYVSDCYLPWQLLSSKRFRLRRVDPLLTNVRGSGIPGSRNQCHKCGLGGNVNKWVGFGGTLKTSILGAKGGQKRGQKRVKNPPFWDPEFVQIAQPDWGKKSPILVPINSAISRFWGFLTPPD